MPTPKFIMLIGVCVANKIDVWYWLDLLLKWHPFAPKVISITIHCIRLSVLVSTFRFSNSYTHFFLKVMAPNQLGIYADTSAVMTKLCWRSSFVKFKLLLVRFWFLPIPGFGLLFPIFNRTSNSSPISRIDIVFSI